jgi:hypothetical protein
MEQVAQIEWKGITWRAAYGDFSVRELLTILKGFGPMEVVEFEKPGCFRGRLSLSLTPEGVKEITVYHLETLGPKRMGKGRDALNFLRNIFKGEVYVQDPGEEVIRVRDANRESILFWIKMFREGVIDALESSLCCLHRQLSVADVDRITGEVEGMLSAAKARQFNDESQE